MTDPSLIRKSDKYIPYYFVLFFIVVAAVNAVFIYKALSTQPGVVDENYYEEGLHYDRELEKAERMAGLGLDQKAEYENGTLRWRILGADRKPLANAKVTAHFIRTVQDGYDFAIELPYKGEGLYEAPAEAPLKGLWTVKLEAQWDTQHYQTEKQIVIK